MTVPMSLIYIHKRIASNPDTNGRRIRVVVSEVSSLKCMQECILGLGKGVLFREVPSVQECPHDERFHCNNVHSSLRVPSKLF